MLLLRTCSTVPEPQAKYGVGLLPSERSKMGSSKEDQG